MSFQDFLSKKRPRKVATTAELKRERRLLPTVPYVNKLPLFSSLPPETRRWIHDASDERAAIEHGCRFVEAKGQYVVDWLEANCVLYEGANAGDPIEIDDWQYNLFMQWGWLWFSKDWAIKTRSEELGWVRRYRKISGFVPKKNAKSPTLAAAGLYTMLADGELGQKCFSVAMDQNQALISHTHALEFVRQSPLLSRRCKINKTTGTITDTLTKSTYSIRAGMNATNQNRNEGLNGSLFVDEIHVVNETQMAILARAGISRRQFMHLQLSTAGRNTAGYGYKETLHGRQNLVAAEQGLPFDFRFKHIEYACPPDTSLEDLRDEEKVRGYVRQANPTLGRIVMEDEIMGDWRSSVSSDTKLTEYAMYRLNLWNSSGGTFIAGSDWDKCSKRFTFKQLKEFPCVIGGDFSRRRDMTSIVVIWAVPTTITIPVDPFDPEAGTKEQEINIPHIHPYFFLPQKAVERYRSHINLDDFASRGLLTITDGATIRPQTIASHIARIDSAFDLRMVGSDSYYSVDVATILQSEHGWNIDGDDSRYRLISQTSSSVGPAVEQLQNCVLNGELVHNSHGLMDWQRGNLTLVEDSNGNRRFAKPNSDDYRKIDGWAGLVNGIFCMMSDPQLYPGQVISLKA